MGLATKIIAVVLFIPVAGVFLYTALHPKDTSLWGKRWQFKNEDLEPSDELIKHNRNMSIAALVVVVIALVIILFKA